jgi:nucleotide-binding universal stress UspA family protein
LARGVEVAKQLGLNPTARLVVGEPIPLIAKIASEISADLVVLGHQRHSALKRWWSGSNSSHLVDLVKCSVLVGCNAIGDAAFEAELQSADAI